MAKKIIAWDFDGPINYAGNYRNQKTRIIHSEARPVNYQGDFPYDIVVNNFEFLQLTLNILAANNVKSIVASQRIHMPDDEHYGRYTRDMYNALDQLFGKNRKFLTQSVGEEIGHPLRGVDTRSTKVPILVAIQRKYNRREKSNIILIDDHADSYKKTTEQEGYRFIHALRDNRSNDFNAAQDSVYLFQALVQTVRVPDIYTSIAKMPRTSATNIFKKCLLHYQLDSLSEVRDAQAELIQAEYPHYQHPALGNLDFIEQAAKDILCGMQHTILDTKWDIGFFGGEKIIDSVTGLKNIIPKNMCYILDEIEKAKSSQINWLDALKTIEQLAKTASAKKSHSWFNQRRETSQLFYDSFHTKNYVTMALQKAGSAPFEASTPLRPSSF